MEHNWSPLEFQLPDGKEIITDEVSNYQSSDLFNLMKKLGITYSYTEDERHHTEAKLKLDKERPFILMEKPSNCHLYQINNLETRMQYVLMLSSNEKLLHFMTQQLVFIEDFYPVLDFFDSQPSYLMDESVCKCNNHETEEIDQFSTCLLNFVSKLMQQLNQDSDVEEFISAVASTVNNDPESSKPKLDIKQMPNK